MATKKVSVALVDLETKALLTALVNDNAALRADIAALSVALVGALAQLDDDETVTDTDYEATWTPTLTSTTATIEA